jgi:hypothetical protein
MIICNNLGGEIMENKIGRAKVFLIIATTLTMLVYSIFHFGEIKAEWYIHPIVVIILALFYTFFPVTSTRALSLFLVIPLGILVTIDGFVFWVTVFLIMVSIFFFQLALAISIFIIPGFILVYGGYKTLNGPGVTIGSVIFVTGIIAFTRRIIKVSKEIVSDTWVKGWASFRKIARYLYETKWISWSLFPEKLIDYIWEGATDIGEALGGDIITSKTFLK